MLLFPNAKLNIGLNVVGLRPDGFRNLESVFYPINWCDALEAVPAKTMQFSVSGIPVPGDSGTNLCLKAYELLQQDFNIPPVTMHLHKAVPIGAGMGGGSSDAAFTLKLLNELFGLHIPVKNLENYARKLGSDCAFFIQNKPVYAFGKGDEFEEINLDLSGYNCLIIYPDLHITTAEAYRNVMPKPAENSLKEALQNPIESWQKLVQNDFETALFPKYPMLQVIKETLYENGAAYASMTGSGSAIFGIFKNEIPAELSFPGNFRVWRGRL